MNYFLRFGAYLLHPLLMPLVGTLLYFFVTPRYVEPGLLQSRLIAVAIITICIPIVSFFLLRNLGAINSIHLETVEERKVPLALQCVLLLVIIKLVFDPIDSPEMYYFFVGVLFSGMSALILSFLKFKVSLHQMGIAGVTMFLLVLSIHFKINMLVWICLFFIGNGWVASSRLHTNSHTYPELIGGFFLGIMPQVLIVPLWL